MYMCSCNRIVSPRGINFWLKILRCLLFLIFSLPWILPSLRLLFVRGHWARTNLFAKDSVVGESTLDWLLCSSSCYIHGNIPFLKVNPRRVFTRLPRGGWRNTTGRICPRNHSLFWFGFSQWYEIMFGFFLCFYGSQPRVVASSYTRPVGLDEPFLKGGVTEEDMFPR